MLINSIWRWTNCTLKGLAEVLPGLIPGTPEALLQASNFFGVIEDRQGLKVACIEEIALYKEFINKQQFEDLVNTIPNSLYREYLDKILNELIEQSVKT